MNTKCSAFLGCMILVSIMGGIFIATQKYQGALHNVFYQTKHIVCCQTKSVSDSAVINAVGDPTESSYVSAPAVLLNSGGDNIEINGIKLTPDLASMESTLILAEEKSIRDYIKENNIVKKLNEEVLPPAEVAKMRILLQQLTHLRKENMDRRISLFSKKLEKFEKTGATTM